LARLTTSLAQLSPLSPAGFRRPNLSSPSHPVADRWDPPIRCVPNLPPPLSPAMAAPRRSSPASRHPLLSCAACPTSTERVTKCAGAATSPLLLPNRLPTEPHWAFMAAPPELLTTVSPRPLPFPLCTIKGALEPLVLPHHLPALSPRTAPQQLELSVAACWRENRTSPPRTTHVTLRFVVRRANQSDLLIDNGKSARELMCLWIKS
jgi:hypothetical protein